MRRSPAINKANGAKTAAIGKKRLKYRALSTEPPCGLWLLRAVAKCDAGDALEPFETLEHHEDGDEENGRDSRDDGESIRRVG